MFRLLTSPIQKRGTSGPDDQGPETFSAPSAIFIQNTLIPSDISFTILSKTSQTSLARYNNNLKCTHTTHHTLYIYIYIYIYTRRNFGRFIKPAHGFKTRAAYHFCDTPRDIYYTYDIKHTDYYTKNQKV